jgi:hypothetical protein
VTRSRHTALRVDDDSLPGRSPTGRPVTVGRTPVGTETWHTPWPFPLRFFESRRLRYALIYKLWVYEACTSCTSRLGELPPWQS